MSMVTPPATRTRPSVSASSRTGWRGQLLRVMPPALGSGAVALLELLARAAPAGVVAAELLVLARAHSLWCGNRADRSSADATAQRRVDDVGAGRGLVLVMEIRTVPSTV